MAGVARRRLDAELVRRKLARSREHASQLIAAGRVTVGKTVATKPATQVETARRHRRRRGRRRPRLRLARRPQARRARWRPSCPQGLAVEGRRALDAGASTGGFTDVLLRAGAAHVVAVDVGYGQLAWSLQSDERVTVKDRTNVRELTLEAIDGEPVDLVVGDLSFIPLGLVLPALARCTEPDADLVMMVKPQFEVGKERLGSGGVVRSPELRAEAVRGVAAAGGGPGARGAGRHRQPAARALGECRVLSVAAGRRARTGPGRCGPCSGGGAALTTEPSSALFSCSRTPGGPPPSAARSWSSRGCCAAASACGSWRPRRPTCRCRTTVETGRRGHPAVPGGLRAAHRPRRRRHAAARRGVRPGVRGADARRQPRQRRLPRGGRARRPRQGRRPGGDPGVRGRGADDRRRRRAQQRRHRAHGLGAERGGRAEGRRREAAGGRPGDRRASGHRVRVRRHRLCDARPARPRTRSRPAGPWCGPRSRRC